MSIGGAISLYAEHKRAKPRWRWIWECSWWERGTETTFEVWAPNWPRPIAALRPQKQP